MEHDHVSDAFDDETGGEIDEVDTTAETREVMPEAEVEDDEDDEDDGGQRPEWLLGFVEPAASTADLLRHRFPSKVGGRPAWMDPRYIPTPQQLRCGSTMLDFLLQVR